MRKNDQKKKSLHESKTLSINRHRGKYARTKGNSYERQIVKELNDLGFHVGTARRNSKAMDDNKVDIYDFDNRLPIAIQTKKTQSIPNYFKIRNESTVDPNKFCILWAKQEPRDTNIVTVGEVAIISKTMLYELLKKYLNE